MYITFTSAKIANKAEPTLALKPRGDVTRNPKQGYQWPQKKGHVSAKNFKKKKKKLDPETSEGVTQYFFFKLNNWIQKLRRG